jgi:hypothetical protein
MRGRATLTFGAQFISTTPLHAARLGHGSSPGPGAMTVADSESRARLRSRAWWEVEWEVR